CAPGNRGLHQLRLSPSFSSAHRGGYRSQVLRDLWEEGTAEWISVRVKRHFQVLRHRPPALPLCLLGKTEGIVLSKRHHNVPAYAIATTPHT
ncbi:unnamed protein product, partial [Gulo gulo]